MKFITTNIADVYMIEVKKQIDERGFFARTFSTSDFKKIAMDFIPVQTSISFNTHKGTLRGLHLQTAAAPEAKLIRCTQGKIYDVIVDLRPSSASFKQWFGIELSAQLHNGVFIPPGCAHGFLTLENDTEILYYMDGFFSPEHAMGYRWNDPAFQIHWPTKPVLISQKDQQWPDFHE